MSQLDLAFEGEPTWDDDRRLLRQMAEGIGLKQVAYDLDVSPSQLSHSLDERDRNMPAKWVRYLVRGAPVELAEEYIGRLAHLRGLDVVPLPSLTPAEELLALKEALSQCLGPELRLAVMQKARRR